MRIVTVMGSPKKAGNTSKALKMVEEQMMLKGHEVDRINVTDYKINGCMGCFACLSRNGEPGCVQQDDAANLLDRIIQADAVIYSSPVFGFNFSAQIKPLLDRHFCLATNMGSPQQSSLIAGKPAALLVTCAGSSEENADLVKAAFERSFGKDGFLRGNIIGEFVIPFSGSPDFDARAKNVAVELAEKLA